MNARNFFKQLFGASFAIVILLLASACQPAAIAAESADPTLAARGEDAQRDER